VGGAKTDTSKAFRGKHGERISLPHMTYIYNKQRTKLEKYEQHPEA